MSLSMAFQPDAFFLIGMGGFLVMGMGLKAGFNQQKLDGSTKNGQKQHTHGIQTETLCSLADEYRMDVNVHVLNIVLVFDG